MKTASRWPSWCPPPFSRGSITPTRWPAFRPFPCASTTSRAFARQSSSRTCCAALRTGELDMVIGTHRLLQKDVKFKDLGAAHRRRGAAVRRGPQGEAQGADPQGRRAHADRHPHSQHAGHGAVGHPGHVASSKQPPLNRQPVQTYVLEHDEGVIARRPAQGAARGAGRCFTCTTGWTPSSARRRRCRPPLPDARIRIGARQNGRGAARRNLGEHGGRGD